MRLIMNWAVRLIACFSVVAMAHAAPVSLGELNAIVDRTNFIVNEGCSGTLISIGERHILTADHCIDRLTVYIEKDEVQPDGTVKTVKRAYRKPLEAKQSVFDADGNIIGTRVYRAGIVKTDAKHDLALIQLSGPVESPIAAIVLPEAAKMFRGETAYIVGNPYGLESTMTKGVISHIKRELPGGGSGIENDVKYTQLDGGAAPGNSGGGVFNEGGQLVGVVVKRVSSDGHLSFAVDIDDIRKFLASIKPPVPVTEHP